MVETPLSLTVDEREYLSRLLQETLKTTLIEEHRTRAPSFREHVVRREELIRSLLAKLDQPAE